MSQVAASRSRLIPAATTTRVLSLLVALCIGLCCPALSAAAAQDASDEEEADQLAPGLVAEYSADGAPPAHVDARVDARVDAAVNFVWRENAHDQPPDPGVPSGPFSAHWQGQLRVLAAGAYRFCVYAGGGNVELSVNGKRILQAKAGAARWLLAEPLELEFGEVPIDVRFRNTSGTARLGLYWAGPQFVLEPVPETALFHDPATTPPHSRALEDGRKLVRGLRCAACHQVPGEPKPLTAPSLAHLSGNIRPEWLSAWVGATPHAPLSKSTSVEKSKDADATEAEAPPGILDVKFRMPGMGIPQNEAADIVAFLQSMAATRNASIANDKKTPDEKTAANDRSAGETLLHSIGCLACHRVGNLGSGSVLGGGDLSTIAAKRPADFFVRWLEDPAPINASHRMPVFPLSPRQRTQLAAYLATLGDVEDSPQSETKVDDRQIERGRRLAGEYRCAACHALADDFNAAPVHNTAARRPLARPAALSASSDWQHACLDEPDAARRRPGYRLTQAQRDAVRIYLVSLASTGSSASTAKSANKADDDSDSRQFPPIDGRQVLSDLNCLACHARGLSEGIAAQTPATTKAHPELAVLSQALAPPALSGVGDKLHDDALAAAIAARDGPRRPWLKIRMPRFKLTDDESAALVRYLVDSDRIPDRPPELATPVGPQSPDAALVVAGSRLVTSDGFGCASCHKIGTAIPQQDTLAPHGTDLSVLGRRIRREWFDRWVRNPARIVPRMEMPSVTTPVRGVLDDSLAGQLSAVWRVLNEPNFTPPEASAVRVVRRRNMPNVAEPAAVLTDVFHLDKRHFIRPLVIGLANRHNVLVDLERNELAAWWIGDTARERTAGKAWFWAPGGTQLFPLHDQQSELTLVRAGRAEPPTIVGQFAAELDWWEHQTVGLRFGYRLKFAADAATSPIQGDKPAVQQANAQESIIVHVVQAIAPLSAPADVRPDRPSTDNKPAATASSATGFRRRFEISGVPADARVRLKVLPDDKASREDDGRTAILATAPGRPRVRIVSPDNARFDASDPASVTLSPRAKGENGKQLSTNGPLICELEYHCDSPADRFPVVLPPDPPMPVVRLNCVPGYEAVQLPLPTAEMPTGLAWRADGTLVYSSLKGQVWLARDTDGDGLEETQSPLSDDLAAPYGVATHGAATDDKSIDVINKNGLLRLYDRDGDGLAERTEVVASGWGHSDDYHDWAVGLPRDELGSYTIALPCQQDNRSLAAAKLRGWVVKLVPREPTPDDPRRFLLQPIAGGLRFPMGIALSRTDDVFVTDNQGNYTPFNELNHVVAGQHYGFINKLEQNNRSIADSRPPHRDAAIEIPHPWSRSVNGICFLDTPPDVRKRLGHDLFGPFEGHLLGCEYNTQRLVRMSLDRVGDTYQGAVYPFSVEPADSASAATFEGPVVASVAPDGDVYVGNLRDSGWGAGRNTGSIVRMRPQGELPAGIAEVRATPRGFQIEFTQPVDSKRASRADSYTIECYRRIATPEYGGADVDRQAVKVQSVEVAADARSAELVLPPLRAGFVYELRMKNLAHAGAMFYPAEAYYTLRVVPK